MWWKIYFWIAVGEAVLAVSSIFFSPGYHLFTQIAMAGIFLVALTGLYGYVFQKKILSKLFWQYFLGIYILIDVLYLIFAAAPDAPLISSLRFLTIYQDSNHLFLNAVIGVVIDIPLLIALFRFTKDEVYKPRPKKKNSAFYRWGLLQTALWGYSLVLTILLFVMIFLPAGETRQVSDKVAIAALATITSLFLPMLIFWLWIVFSYKKYKWNWWRTTLVANGLFYSGTLIYGVLFPPAQQGNSGFDIFSVLQLLILFISLYVFGREQFK